MDKQTEIDLIDYTDFIQDAIRISHEVSSLTPPPTKQQLQEMPRKKAERKINQEIKRRKWIMAGLDVEIQELEELKK